MPHFPPDPRSTHWYRSWMCPWLSFLVLPSISFLDAQMGIIRIFCTGSNSWMCPWVSFLDVPMGIILGSSQYTILGCAHGYQSWIFPVNHFWMHQWVSFLYFAQGLILGCVYGHHSWILLNISVLYAPMGIILGSAPFLSGGQDAAVSPVLALAWEDRRIKGFSFPLGKTPESRSEPRRL